MTLDELTYKINGCAMKVHSAMGNGFQEVIYQRCLAIEFQKAAISYGREVEQTLYYEGIVVGTRGAQSLQFKKIYNPKFTPKNKPTTTPTPTLQSTAIPQIK